MATAKKFNIERYAMAVQTVQFQIEDLRTVMNAVGTNDRTKLDELGYINEHYGKGLNPPIEHRALKADGDPRGMKTEKPQVLSYNIRNQVHDHGLGLGSTSGGWGVDLVSLKVHNLQNQSDDPSILPKVKGDDKTHFEHTTEIKKIGDIVVDQVLNGSNELGSHKASMIFFAREHLMTAITKQEQDDSKLASKEISSQASIQPLVRYRLAGSTILMRTGQAGANSLVEVTSKTHTQLMEIRDMNPDHINMMREINEFPGYSKTQIEQMRDDWHSVRMSTDKQYKGQMSSGYVPRLTDENLKIILNNDPMELCKKFYKWKIR